MLIADRLQVPCTRVLHVQRSVVVDANIVYGAFHHPGLFITEQWQSILYNLLHRVWVPSVYNGVKEPVRRFKYQTSCGSLFPAKRI
jgi:hypothetical protein